MKTWYVYLLCNPDTGNPFYVGKGTGKRMYDHENDHSGVNQEKRDIIRRLREQGKEVLKKKIAEFSLETDALIYEWAMINLYHEQITNIHPGGSKPRTQKQRDQKPFPPHDYATLDEIAEYLGMTRATLYNYMSDLKIKTQKFGRDKRAYLSREQIKLIEEYRESPWKVKTDDSSKGEAA